MDTLKYRTGLKRIWAAVIDWIVFMPLLLIGKWIYKSTENLSLLSAWATFIVFAPYFYSVILHYKYGQTIGKWVAGVKVIDISEARQLTVWQSLYRDGLFLLCAAVGLLYYIALLISSKEANASITDYYHLAEQLMFYWTLLELITMLTNSKRRGVHDLIARSIVIRTGIK
jgi:uncharacterized RDD family membrane protein YckC